MGVVKKHSTSIDGIAYTTETFPATQGLDLVQRLAAMVGPDLATLIFTSDDDGTGGIWELFKSMAVESGAESDDGEVMLQAMALAAAAIGKAAERAQPGEFASFAKALLARTTADKVTLGDTEAPGLVATHFDDHFAGRYFHLLEVCIWVARVGFVRP